MYEVESLGGAFNIQTPARQAALGGGPRVWVNAFHGEVTRPYHAVGKQENPEPSPESQSPWKFLAANAFHQGTEPRWVRKPWHPDPQRNWAGWPSHLKAKQVHLLQVPHLPPRPKAVAAGSWPCRCAATAISTQIDLEQFQL